MSKYVKLFNNTLAFALGSFGSKFLQFFLLPFYTRALSTSDYGIIDLTVQTVNIAVPLLCLCIYDAVMRFSMDASVNKSDALRIGLRFIVFSFAASIAVIIFFNPLRTIDNIDLIALIIMTQGIRTLFAQYVRAIGRIKLFSFSGIVQTFVLASSNILMLSVFKMGIRGYLLSLVLADAISMLVLLIWSDIVRDLQKGKYDRRLFKSMLLYSIPLVPNTVMWWGMNASNRYFLAHYHGLDSNGLYAVATKIPSILTMLMTIFIQAWQLSAIEEYETDENSSYYSNIYSALESFLYISGVGMTILLKPFWLSLGSNFNEALLMVPPITMSVIFSSLSSFFGSVYLASKKTGGILLTTFYGAVIGIILNFLLIPKYAGLGAGISVACSFLFMSIYRYFDVKRYVAVIVDFKRVISNTFVLLLSFIVVYSRNMLLSITIAIITSILIIIVNRKNIGMLLNMLKNAKEITK